MSTPDDVLIDGYADALVDGDFVAEFQEGSNRGKFFTPDQMAKLIEARDRARSSEHRRANGIFKRVVD
jgi:hypothetical protein